MSGTPQAFTVDVEDYFQVNAFESVVSRSDWEQLPGRVAGAVDRVLDLLERRGASGTFFILGWVAERYPDIPRAIAAAGHEIASHGWWHRRVFELSPQEFRSEVRDSKALLEDLTGRRVRGYRAPSFSLLPEVEWAYDVLIEEGYAYDSSVFPIRRREYGNPGAHPEPHTVRRDRGRILELPLATRRVAGLRIPGAGGAYLRILPYAVTRGTAAAYHGRDATGVFYVHPWELDPDQPRLTVPLTSRFRHYTGLDRTMPRLERLLSEFEFSSIERCFAPEIAEIEETSMASGGPTRASTSAGT